MSTDDHRQEDSQEVQGSEQPESAEAQTNASVEGEGAGLEERLAEAEREKDQFKRLAQRAQADLVNYRNRVRGEQEALQARAAERVATRFLEVADQLEKALEPAAVSGVDEQWVVGVNGIYQNLLNVLRAEGIERYDAHGEEFDPRRHDALLASPSNEHPANHVMRQLAAGYIRNGEVLRPAQVEIATAPIAEDPDDQKQEEGQQTS